MQTTVQHNGHTWHLFSAEYDAGDALGGISSFHFYAISHDHAEIVLEEIRSTARVIGQVVGIKEK